MRRLLSVVACSVLLLSTHAGASRAQAEPPAFSFHRASLGLTASGDQFTTANGGRVTSFVPGGYLSYSVTSTLSAGATIERDFPRQTTIGKAGLRFVVLEGTKGQVGVGANLVAYGDRRDWLGVVKPTSWESVVAGSYDVIGKASGATAVWGIVQGGWDEQNAIKWVKVGLRWQLFGGHP